MKAIIILFLIIGMCFATIDILSPISKNVENREIVYLGTMGPGQTIGISFNPEVYKGGKYGTGGFWDYIEIIDVPNGWKGFESKLYANPSQIEITAAKNAPEGNYSSTILIHDENNADELGQITLFLITEIKHDLIDVDVTPKSKKVGTNQPAIVTIKLKNKGMVPDKFEISSSGIQHWDFKKSVYVPGNEEIELLYEIVGNEEEKYNIQITATSESSSIITNSKKIELTVDTNLISDWKATNNGLLIFPIIEAPIYSLMGLISNLF
ncbi:hypothetical protein KO317_03265 [Candidatus Micrarchaeota archaeon]|nr:hypothetical protein [Candidatus Micrarchaeota archaeon]